MLTKNTVKRITSLHITKYRYQYDTFIAEGPKLVDEILYSNLNIVELYHTKDWYHPRMEKVNVSTLVTSDEMRSISALTTPSHVLAVIEIPKYDIADIDPQNQLIIALDTIQDPGNLGTIIRLADWFGIDSILCSTDTVDIFSPKVVQASMGAITRVKVFYCHLASELAKTKGDAPIYGTFMEGENIYTTNLNSTGIIIMGNEGKGISPEIEKLVTQKIHIPTFAKDRSIVESLNVAMATAIVCSEFRRRN